MATKRLTLTLTPEAEKQMEELKKYFGNNSSAEAIRRAITLLKIIKEDRGDARPNLVFKAGYLSGLLGEPLKLHGHGHADLKTENPLLWDTTNEPEPRPLPTLVVSSVIIPERTVTDGLVVLSETVIWREIVKHLERDWNNAFNIPPLKWEEIIAGAFKREGFDEVILTPSSNDKGRDIIAFTKGIGKVKVLGSVKAYAPDRLVRHDDVRALVGVLAMEPDSSKAVITTTSDFAPKIWKDDRYINLMPTRLRLVNGKQLQEWLVQLSKRK